MKFLPMCGCSLAVLACSFFSEEGKGDSSSLSQDAGLGSSSASATLSTIRPGLPSIRVDRLSSGALRMLDHGGDLVRPSSATHLTIETAQTSTDPMVNAGLDPRVGSNIRLGSDPPQLPSNLRAQAEPHIARHPANSDLLAGTFQEGRYTDGGSVDCGYAISHDGGLSWSRALIPGVTAVTGGPYYRASDPVAGIDRNGVIYLNTLALIDSTLATSALLVSRSTNGGTSFGPPVEAIRSPNSTILLDKNWMAINTFAGTPTAGRIILTFTRFTSTANPIACTISDDGGKTWTPNAFITPSSYDAQSSEPVFLPDGKLAVVYWHFNPDRLEVVLSTNGGNTFNSPRLITNVAAYDAPGIRDGVFVSSATSDRTAGKLLVVYQGLYLSKPSILFTKSADGSVTWTTPQPITDNASNTPVFNPAIAVSPDGQVVSVAFYDGRMNGGNANLVDVFLAQSFDGGTTWQPNLRVTSVSSDVRQAPLTDSGYMLGDYLGVAPSTSADVPAVPIWVDTRGPTPDPFIGRVGMARALTFAGWRAARFSLAEINDPLLGGAGADPDKDGAVNLVEYALGLDPRSSDRAVLSAMMAGAGSGESFSTSYERLRGTTDLNYSWTRSASLSNWSAVVPSSVVVTPSTVRQTETVTSNFGPATNANQFYRLGVSLKN